MDATSQLDTIVRLLEQLGIETRQERLGGSGGGLCKIRDQRIVFIDLDADAATRVDRCIEALAALPETARVFLSPELREKIDQLRSASVKERMAGDA